MKALIIGGGIGGLATAIALRKIGLDCQVLEQSERAIRYQVGAGLSLWSNAILVIRELGLEDEVCSCGTVIERTHAITSGGRVLAETDIAALGKTAGAPSVCIHRAELHRILASALPSAVVRPSTRCVSFAVRGASVIAHMSDGSTYNCDILIGADGIHSAVRAQLLGDEAPRYAGYTCWRGMASGEWTSDGTALVLLGSGMQAGLFPCGPGRFYWFGTRNAPPRAGIELADLVSGCPRDIQEAIFATPENEILRTDIHDRPPVLCWGKGPVTLLGDAAHPSTPVLGQGACQALEDAVALAGCLAAPGPVCDSLRAYERRRMPRTAFVTNESWRMGLMLQTENPLVTVTRNLMAATPAGRFGATKLLRQLLCGS